MRERRQRAIEALGRIDIFVSNPAFQRRADFLEFDPETFAKVLEGTLDRRVSHEPVRGAAHGRARRRREDRLHLERPRPHAVCRQRRLQRRQGGLNHMAFTIAAELYPHRINVNVIEPGWIDTPGEHEAFGDEVMAKAGAALPGAGSARPRTSARPPCSSPPTTPTTSPAPRCASTAGSGSNTLTSKGTLPCFSPFAAQTKTK